MKREMKRRTFTKMAMTALITLMLVGGYTSLSVATPVEWSSGSGGNGHYYEAIAASTGIAWYEAKAKAESVGGYLATITSSDENSFIHALINSDDSLWINGDMLGGNSLGPWIGAFKTSNSFNPYEGWQWVTGENFDYTNWSAGEPNNLYNLENSVHFIGAGVNNFSSAWNDLPDNPAVSFNVPINPVAYVVEYERIPEPENNPTPEPATMTLMGVGLIGLGVFGRKFKANKIS